MVSLLSDALSSRLIYAMTSPDDQSRNSSATRSVLVAGATGTIGSAVVQKLVSRGFRVVALVRRGSSHLDVPHVEWREIDFDDPASPRNGFGSDIYDAAISCLASRKGGKRDAWTVDDAAQRQIIATAKQCGVKHFVLLSALCVQKPKLEFQFAKLSAEKALLESGLTYSIVRPTAFFKSLSGQIERVKAGKPFLLFGDGKLTACKPISDRDLATFLVDCINDESCRNKVLPIGGPGRAITPREQGEELFRLMNMKPKFKSVPVALMDVIISILSFAGFFFPVLKDKAEFARIGKYYATESMLVLDPATGRYSEEMTPSAGKDHLFDFYADVIAGKARVERGDHAVF